MRKLSKKKMKWIIRWHNNGKSNRYLAECQQISERRVRQILSEYKRTGKVIIKHPGRKKKPIPLEYIKLILDEYKETRQKAVFLEKIICKRYKIRIPHNTIHMVLLHAGISREEPRKQKRRKPWIRYERKHSLSLVHTDWHVSKAIPGKHVIAYEDDASRKILAMDEWDAELEKYALITLKKAMKEAEPFGGIVQLLSDRGSQFHANKGEGVTEFQAFTDKHGIKQIFCRVKHPQTNGKMEKWFSCYNQHRGRFRTAQDFVDWYNNRRPHMSLNMRHAETPSEAFIRKMDPVIWLSKVRWFE